MFTGERVVPIKLDLRVNHTLIKDRFQIKMKSGKRNLKKRASIRENHCADLNNFESDPEEAGGFIENLSVRIGGSALGVQFVAEALAPENPSLKKRYIDNTDVAGIDHQIAQLGPRLVSTLVILISKSGGTPETRNGMLEVQKAFREAGLELVKQVLQSLKRIHYWTTQHELRDG